ncbi:helix-turn-helix transcriptional regulator [Streptococcus oriscaviae]|uniref:YafY family transcriptional regulator n=1 Tax=Streptococcus oriscaviae TaxID=2781599 RepID=A0ABX7YK44_9STRE|nr:YafY family protein [Streptococcus oriscaviae]QUE54068.1 YafY family transcriptional regulator [Streptococcus oriscaviae]
MKESRLFGLLYTILERKRVTAKELAEKFEVSIRTIYRDLDALSASGIPVYTQKGRTGGIAIAEEFVLSKSLLTVDEREQILSSLHGLSAAGKGDEDQLLTKLSALFRLKQTKWIEIDFSFWQKDQAYDSLFQDIKEAILDKKILAFTYFSSREEESRRRVKPIRLLFKGQDWYLYAYCLLRKDFRYFKLSRIRQLKTENIQFEEDFGDFRLKTELPQQDTIAVCLKFDRNQAFRVYDELGQLVSEDQAGNLYATVHLPADYNLYQYIFSFGEGVEVLKPESVRHQVKEMIEKMAEKYKS